jgi:hypothetical protein
MYAYEVGTQGTVESLMLEDWLRDPPYYTYISTIDIAESPHLHRLQPSVSLDESGLPIVFWHADNGTYDVMYSRALSMTKTGTRIFSWSEPTIFHVGTAGHSGSPAVAQASVISPVLHVTYLRTPVVDRDWETYYEGREAGYTPGDYIVVFLPLVLRQYNGPG